jgi:hypothetical protein
MTKKTFDPELKNLMIIDKIEEMMDDAQTVLNTTAVDESYTRADAVLRCLEELIEIAIAEEDIREDAWITFFEEGAGEEVWYPITDNLGQQMKYDSEVTMDACRRMFSDRVFGIAPTSQKEMRNAVRDNI